MASTQVPTFLSWLAFLLSTNLSEVLKYNNDYSDEFAALKKVYDDYIQAKVKIQSSNQFKTRLFQSLPFALPGIVGVVIGFLGKGKENGKR
jgi:hypothetical protein